MHITIDVCDSSVDPIWATQTVERRHEVQSGALPSQLLPNPLPPRTGVEQTPFQLVREDREVLIVGEPSGRGRGRPLWGGKQFACEKKAKCTSRTANPLCPLQETE